MEVLEDILGDRFTSGGGGGRPAVRDRCGMSLVNYFTDLGSFVLITLLLNAIHKLSMYKVEC